VLRNNPRQKVMTIDVYERISSQVANEFESGARPELKPWNAESGAGRIASAGPARRGVSNAAA
jgi:antirestriction protein ArdC